MNIGEDGLKLKGFFFNKKFKHLNSKHLKEKKKKFKNKNIKIKILSFNNIYFIFCIYKKLLEISLIIINV